MKYDFIDEGRGITHCEIEIFADINHIQPQCTLQITEALVKNGFTPGTSTSDSKIRASERVDTEYWILTVSFYKGVDIDVGAKVRVLTLHIFPLLPI